METKNPIQVSERIFHTIECLAQNGPMGLLELSSELELNKSTVHRILNSLIYMDYVKQDPDTLKYTLSLKFCRISNQILSQNSVIDLTRPYLKELAELSGEIVHLVEIEGVHAVYIDKVEATHNSVRLISKVGKSIPLYCSGVGKAMLADMEDDKIRSIWEQSDIQRFTEHTITDFDQFMERIREVRKDGYATDDEENELGVRCVAISVKDYKGKTKYAISISAPIARMEKKRMKELAKELVKVREQLAKEWAGK
ncbi:MAG: IclR family transcriptional regulator C-terminal domain-containing protein [Lachnospiraceae bacterium]|nr:IclR family transcriptional regulator C-terminal domain-containing protein [Lachnospiraceae bacterium]